MRTSKVYSILAHAILDAPFRESLFRNGRQITEEWDLTSGESAYLKELPYDAFEQMVGRMISHWLVPIPVNDRYMILPELADDVLPDGFIPIYLTENFAFGNGAHATTALCLSALDDYLLPGGNVLDLGSGSGILSIAAALQGAGTVLALDIDPASVEIARKNTGLNSVDKSVTVEQGSLEGAQRAASAIGGFDLAVVNILTPVVLSLLEDGLVKILKPGAVLITSGIESSEVSLMEQALLKAGLSNLEKKEMDGWAALVSQRPPMPDKRR